MKHFLRAVISAVVVVAPGGVTTAQAPPPPAPGGRCTTELVGVSTGWVNWKWSWSSNTSPVTVRGEILRVYGFDQNGDPLYSPNTWDWFDGPPGTTPNATSGTSANPNNKTVTTGDMYTSKVVIRSGGSVVGSNRSSVITAP